MNDDAAHQTAQAQEAELVAADDAVIGKAFLWSLVVIAAIALLAALAWWVLTQETSEEPLVADSPVFTPKLERPAPASPIPSVRFTDVTESSGLTFVHENGAYGERLLPETMGSGVAFLDYDNDGDQDILLVNSTFWPGRSTPDATNPTMALYANDGQGHFTDVTASAGLGDSFYGTGVAVGDYDGDGWVDVFIAAVGANRLYRNDRGFFTDVTPRAGVAGASDSWSTSAAFFDFDNDGDLDLFVANYVKWSKELDLEVDYRLTGVGRAYGPPTNFGGTHSYLYRNDGKGRFKDVSLRAGIQVTNPANGRPMGKGLAVVPLDVDRDGYMDLFVANDTVQNFFFRNRGDGTFSEDGLITGLAFDRDGRATGAMGTDAAYYRNGENLGIAIGNFSNEMTSLYVSQTSASEFLDEAIIDGIGPASRLALTFGVFFFDYDLDGRLDLLQVNGHLESEINRIQSSQQYEQPPQLFWNCGDGCPTTFVAVNGETLGALSRPLVGRGASYADIDGDGDLDIIVTQPGRRARLFRNDQALGHHWLRVKLAGRAGNRDAIGAWIEVRAGGITQRRRVMPARGYLSQVELPVTFGLGPVTRINTVRVGWPDGSIKTLDDVAVDQFILIRQGRD